MGMVAPTDNVRLVGLKVVYMDSIGSLLLAGVHNVGVDLSCLDVGMPEHILDDILKFPTPYFKGWEEQ